MTPPPDSSLIVDDGDADRPRSWTGSNAGIPGVQIPIALDPTSTLPIGLELDGPAGSDRRLLAIGIALDGVFGRLPPPHRS
ncbi:Asp-tRNA(Asn)/Glu-tRNA(Gln) amidotransferase A subunit family amidase [Bradyrhizobium diazoefficiens]